MDIDMSEIHEIFFEESFEGLDVMESGLLNLDLGDADTEIINDIFRAAHSIKGGGGTFGFMEISNFTHGVETILDEMRDGVRPVTKSDVDLLLESVDCIRSMMEASQNDEPYNTQRIEELNERIEATLKEGAPSDDGESKPSVNNEAQNNDQEIGSHWQIIFKPDSNMLQTGNEPINIFKELEKLGELSVAVHTDNLPNLDEFNSENCYLHWTLELKGEVEESQIREVFDWVEQECSLEINCLATKSDDEPEASEELENKQEDKAQAKVEKQKEEPKKVAASKPVAKKQEKGKGSNESIRVSTDKVDNLINLVGELVITQSMLSHFGTSDFAMNQIDELRKGLTQLMRNTRELQESVMQIRMLPISFSFNRFPRLVHDLSSKIGKKVELKLSGENTELDKTVLEKINDPLVHLVRNSLDHGLETPDVRVDNNKPETGTLELNAFHEGGHIIIEVVDDGAGINQKKVLQKAIDKGIVSEDDNLTDEQICNLIFHAGFSTADQVSDLSGRGVGMDVVKRNIISCGGQVSIKSEPGMGSKITISLPLTLAILDGQLVRVGEQIYIIPLISIIESLQMSIERVSAIANKAELYKLRDEYIPIVRLYELFGIESKHQDFAKGLLVVVESENMRMGIFVDDLLEQQQVVIKSLEANYQHIEGLSGATILGDGTVAMILDIPGVIARFNEFNKKLGLPEVA